MDSFRVGDVGARVDLDHVTVSYAQVVTDDAIHAYLLVFELVGGYCDADGGFSHFAFDNHGITLENF